MSKREELREYISQELVEHPVTDFLHHAAKSEDHADRSRLIYRKLSKKAADKKIAHHEKKAKIHDAKAREIYKKHKLYNHFKDAEDYETAKFHAKLLHGWTKSTLFPEHRKPARKRVKYLKGHFNAQGKDGKSYIVDPSDLKYWNDITR